MLRQHGDEVSLMIKNWGWHTSCTRPHMLSYTRDAEPSMVKVITTTPSAWTFVNEIDGRDYWTAWNCLVTSESAAPVSHSYWLLLNVNIPSMLRVTKIPNRRRQRFPQPNSKKSIPFSFHSSRWNSETCLRKRRKANRLSRKIKILWLLCILWIVPRDSNLVVLAESSAFRSIYWSEAQELQPTLRSQPRAFCLWLPLYPQTQGFVYFLIDFSLL